jgi:hypothetical protein
MTQVYSAPPAGGLFNIPEALPQGLLYRYKKISNLSRQNLKLPPNNGQGDVWAGQKIIVTLPQNALIDLSTFTMDFKGYTQHNGTNGITGATGYCQSRFFPRNTQSLIETLEIKIGGQTRQLINNYGYIYNILMILPLELMLQIKIVLDKMQIHHVNIIHLNLEHVDVVDFLLV